MSTDRQAAVAAEVARVLGRAPVPIRLEPVAGGCINCAATFHAHGERFFVKWNDHRLPGHFEAEARGLAALAGADCGLVVPRPVAWSDRDPAFLVLDHVAPGRPGPGHDEDLGRGLARLHQHGDSRGFGFDLPGYCGATPQPNPWTGTWLEFYREHRLHHQLSLAAGNGLPTAVQRDVRALVERLDGLLPDEEPSSLVHGDLWSGNLHTTAAGLPGLIDPAAYFGHREAELGMMVLFGGFSARVYSAYDEARPLQPGWRARLDLYALYHLLNHFNLFGGGYGRQAHAIACRFL